MVSKNTNKPTPHTQKSKLIAIGNRLVVARGEGRGEVEREGGEMSEEGQNVQTSSNKINHGHIMYSMTTVVKNNLYCVFESC